MKKHLDKEEAIWYNKWVASKASEKKETKNFQKSLTKSQRCDKIVKLLEGSGQETTKTGPWKLNNIVSNENEPILVNSRVLVILEKMTLAYSSNTS